MISNDLFFSNRTPTDEEKKELRKRTIQHAARLQEIEPDIAELEARLQLLYAERDHIRQMEKNYISALSPFRMLPEDVLREVCLACIVDSSSSPVHRNQPPAVLTRISRDIRRIALSTPALWTSMYVSYASFRQQGRDKKSIARMESYAAEISLWINNLSGSLPLSITVTDRAKFRTSPPLYTAITDNIMDVVLKCCSRWEDIKFNWVSFPPHAVDKCLLIDAPLLRSLTFRLDGSHFAFHSHKFLQAPNLQKFVLDLQRQHNLRIDTVNWANLTYLSFRGYIWHHSTVLSSVARVIGQTPLLVKLCLNLPMVSEKTPLSEVYLPCLDTLTVDEVLDGDTLGVLQVIHAPILRFLSIESENGPRTDAILHLLNLSPKVTHFRIDLAPSYTRLVKYLRHCPYLKVLELDQVGNPIAFADPLLKALVLHEYTCPQLEQFTCGIRLNVSADVMVEFFQKRLEDERGLNSWRNIRFCIYDKKELQKVLEQLDQAGISLPPDQISSNSYLGDLANNDTQWFSSGSDSY